MRPARVLVLPEALKYPLTREIMASFERDGIPVRVLKSNQVTGIPSKDERTTFFEAKRTVVLSVRKRAVLQSCRPSANYQLPLISGCPGHCQYCYLHTTFGKKPYIRVYVNRDEILQWAEEDICKRKPFVTVFEGAATSDPVPMEPWTGTLRHAIEYFGRHPYARFRFVTKFDFIDSLLDANHGFHTRIRFTVNTPTVVENWDKGTAGLERRLKAARKVAEAGYLYGFLIGPIVVYDGWEREYAELIELVADTLPAGSRGRCSFELITHRFTSRAKELILTMYPDTTLDMSEENRTWKHGQFGYGKFVYTAEVYDKIRTLLYSRLERHFPNARIMYLV